MTQENKEIINKYRGRDGEWVYVYKETGSTAVNKSTGEVVDVGQPQDLTHHKTEETDTLVKAAEPADDFMRHNDLDKETHGKADEESNSSN